MQKLILAITLLVTISISPVFAEDFSGQNIVLNTDKTAYNEGDVITVTGNVEKVIADLEVSIQIFFEKNLIQIAQVPVTAEGKFTSTFVAEGKQWQNEGSIIIKATYGSGASAEIMTKFFKETGTNFTSNYEVNIPDGGTFDINYVMKGGIVKLMSINPNELSMNIMIDTDSNGGISLSIPRSDVDAINENGTDEKFIVLIYTDDKANPIQTDFRELETTDKLRSIYIPIKDGDTKIQIIGTHIIPEFGTMIQLILLTAIIITVVITAKSKVPIFTKL